MRNTLEYLSYSLEKKSALEQSLEKLEEQGALLLRSPPGTGKTAVSLAYLLSQAEQGKRGVIFFRTKAQIDQGLNLLNEMIHQNAEPPLITPLVGKEEACLYPPSDTRKLRWWCRIRNCERRHDRGGHHIREKIKEQEGKNMSIDQYITISRQNGVCPYYALRELCEKASVILTTYPFFVNKELYKFIGKRDYMFLDEAHGLLMLITKKIKKTRFKKGNKLVKATRKEGIQPNDYILSLLRDEKVEKASILAEYLSFKQREGQIYETKHKFLKVLPPQKLLQERASNVKCMVMSSTLYPSNLYKMVFGISNMHVIKGMLKPSKKRLILGYASEVTSKYNKRSKRMYAKYADLIQVITRHMNVSTLIFAPSYSFASPLSNELGFPVTHKIEKIPTHLQKYGKVLTVARSSLSEGVDINFQGEEPRLLLITGLPYPRISDTFENVAKAYAHSYNIRKEKFMKALNRSSMVSALVQMIGRTGRNKKGIAIILDKRLQYFNFNFPIYTSLSTLLDDIKEFDIGKDKVK